MEGILNIENMYNILRNNPRTWYYRVIATLYLQARIHGKWLPSIVDQVVVGSTPIRHP